MIIISFVNILIFIALSICGLIFLIKNRRFANAIIQLNINIRTTTSFFVMLALGAILMTAIFLVNIKLGLITVTSQQNIAVLLKNIPNEFINAFGEELLLRVLVFVGIISIIKNKIIALLVSSLIFCFLHSPQNMIGFSSYFLAGSMYGISFLMFKTIWAPTGLHFAWNYFQGVVFGFPVGNRISDGYYVINVIESEIWNGGAFGPEGSILGICARVLIIFSIILISLILKSFLNAPDFLKLKTEETTIL
jgi:uncharacterized protein